MAHPLKKSERKREEPKLGEPKLVEPDNVSEIPIAQELHGESVSDTLIRARQQVGQDLRSIAEVLCIRYSYLDAIERGQYENLPGATYAVGFVRSYAEYLGLDGEQVVERFKSEVEGLDSQTKLHFPTPAPEGKMPGGAVFLVAALLFAGAYGVWFYLSNKGESLSDLVAPVPEQLQDLVSGDAPSPTPDPAAGSTATTTVDSAAPAAVVETPSGSASSGTSATSESAPQAAALPPSAPAAIEPAPEATPAAPVETPAAEAVPAPATEDATARNAGESQPATTQTADLSAGTGAESAAAESGRQAAMTAPEAPAAPAPAAEIPAAETPASEEPAAEASARSDAYAIPVAPDSDTPATAFLTNHEPQVYGEENADARIVLKATQDAWVQVRDRQGTLLLTRVLRVGDTYRVPNQDDLTLLTGNAGGLEITVDGQALAPLGPVGAVRRNIPLTPEGLASR